VPVDIALPIFITLEGAREVSAYIPPDDLLAFWDRVEFQIYINGQTPCGPLRRIPALDLKQFYILPAFRVADQNRDILKP
jgi:hypothetical protein